MSETAVSLQNLTLAYGDTVAVPSLNLDIRKGELIALLGPSGCGKTTTMRAIAGLMAPKSGNIIIDGANVTKVSANKRGVGLVFQSYALFPNLSGFENIAFGLRLKKRPAAEIKQKVEAGLELVGLAHLADRKPAELSGGQQQRLSLARSLVMKPKVLLLDEPLSNLDARLRLEMRTELQKLQRQTKITMVFVTHDQAEALAKMIVAKGLSARQAEALAKQPAGKAGQKSRPPEKSADIKALEKQAAEKLGLAFHIDWNEAKDRGKVTIDCQSLDQMTNLLAQLGIR